MPLTTTTFWKPSFIAFISGVRISRFRSRLHRTLRPPREKHVIMRHVHRTVIVHVVIHPRRPFCVSSSTRRPTLESLRLSCLLCSTAPLCDAWRTIVREHVLFQNDVHLRVVSKHRLLYVVLHAVIPSKFV